MKWVTREGAKTDRVACPWLIAKFIDPQAEFLFVPKDDVVEVARREGGKSFDCPRADYTHREGKCSFEVLVDAYNLSDPALRLLARSSMGPTWRGTWASFRKRLASRRSRTALL